MVGVRLDFLDEPGGVPDVPAVEVDAERGPARVIQQIDRFGEGRDHRPVLGADAIDRLETDAQTESCGFLAYRLQPFDDRVAILTRPSQANDAAGLERGETVQR